MSNIHVHGFKIPATREAIGTDQLHADRKRNRDSEQDRQECAID